MKVTRRTWLLIPLVAFAACLEDLADVDKISVKTLHPEFGFPVAYSQFTIKDFLSRKASTGFIDTTRDPIVLVYEKKLFSQSASTVFSVPDQTIPTKTFNGVDFPFATPGATATFSSSDSFTMNTNGEKLDSIHLKDGSLTVNISSDFPASIDLQVTFPTITIGSSPLVLDYSYSYPGSGPGSWSESDQVTLEIASIDLTSGGSSFNELPYEFAVNVTDEGQPLSAANSINIDLGITNLVFGALFGKLGTKNFAAPEDSVNLDVLNSAIGGSFQPEDARMILMFSNSIGASMGVDISSVGAYSNENGAMTLSGPAVNAPMNPYVVAGPGINAVGNSVSTDIELNTSNSNFFDIITSLPTFIYYKFDGQLNPTNPNANNFVTDTSKVEITLRTEVPLHGIISDLLIQEDFDFDGSGLEDVKGLTFVQKSLNEFPLDLEAQAYFLDGSGNVLDVLYQDDISVIKSAPIDANGESTGATEFNKEVQLLDSQIDNIKQAKQLRLVVVLNSASATVAVKILSENQLIIQLGIKGSLEYTLE